MKIKLSKSQWEGIGKKAGWENGYYKGELKDGYPPSYFDENGTFRYPFENSTSTKKVENTVKNPEDAQKIMELANEIINPKGFRIDLEYVASLLEHAYTAGFNRGVERFSSNLEK